MIRNLLNVKLHAPYKSMYSKYQIIKILENCSQNTNCFSWIMLILVLIHPCLPHHPCQILPKPTETPLQHNPHHVFHRFPYFVLPYLITHHHKYWIKQIICQANSIKLVIKLFLGLNTLWVKHATHQKADFLRILTWKKYRQIKFQCLQKAGIWEFGSVVHQINFL